MESGSPRARMVRVLGVNGIVLAVLVTAGFAVLEVAARVYLVKYAPESTFRRYASLHQWEAHLARRDVPLEKYTPHRYIGYIPTPGYELGANRHNALGYRGDEIPLSKPAGEFRIVCIGGSTTYTPDVEDWRLSYPAQLEMILREGGHDVRVINAGAESWMSYESLINFELRVLEVEPDLVIVYHAINDLIGRFVYPPESYVGDNSGAKGPRVTDIFMPGSVEYSTLGRWWLVRTGRVLPHTSLDASLNSWRPTFVAYDWYEQTRTGTYPRGVFADTSAAELLEQNSPAYFQRNIAHLAALARSRGIDVVIASFAYSPEFTDNPWATRPETTEAFREANALLEQTARDTGSRFYDFASEFPTDAAYYTDGFHVNEEGAHLKARLFAEYVLQTDVLP